METKVSYRELLDLTTKSSGYYSYEVEDIARHLIGNMQRLLGEGKIVKIPGIGSFHVAEVVYKKIENSQELCYDAFKLRASLDASMKRYLKENYASRTKP